MSYYFTLSTFVWLDDVSLISRDLFLKDVDYPLRLQKCPQGPPPNTGKVCSLPPFLYCLLELQLISSATPGRLVGKSCGSHHQDPPYSEQTCLGKGLQKELAVKYGSLFLRSLCPNFHSRTERAATNGEGTEYSMNTSLINEFNKYSTFQNKQTEAK